MQQKKAKLIYINGGSGVGKSTIGNLLIGDIRWAVSRVDPNISDEDIVLIDQDSFYLKDKPQVEYEYRQDDKVVRVVESNWDTLDAIDMMAFNDKIEEEMKVRKFVIVTGFALRPSWGVGEGVITEKGIPSARENRENGMRLKPDCNILLNYNLSDSDAKLVMREARAKSKGYTGAKKLKDMHRIECVIWPYYQETLSLLGVEGQRKEETGIKKIDVFYSGSMNRRNVTAIIQDICAVFQRGRLLYDV